MTQRRLRPSQGGKFMPPVDPRTEAVGWSAIAERRVFRSYADASLPYPIVGKHEVAFVKSMERLERSRRPASVESVTATFPADAKIRYWDESPSAPVPLPLRLSEKRYDYRVEFPKEPTEPTEPTETTPGELVANAIFEMRCPHCYSKKLTPDNARFAMSIPGRLVICAGCSRVECRALGRCEWCGVKSGHPHARQCTVVQHRDPTVTTPRRRW